MMSKKDANHDGKISFDELKQALTDCGWMKKHLGKTHKLNMKSVTDTAFAGKSVSSRMCLVM